MASVAGVADIGMSIGKLATRGNSAERRGAKSEFLGWCIEFDRQICWIIGRAPMP
jgi:hypothetical protein